MRKNTIYGLFAMFMLPVFLVALASCHDDEDDEMPAYHNEYGGTVEDREGNTYNWVRIGDLCWTTKNAAVGDSMIWARYDNNGLLERVFAYSSSRNRIKKNYIPVYGNLMNYDQALRSAPEGWRLPTDEDWKNLERAFGMGSDVDDRGWRGTYQSELMRDSVGTKLGLILGGAIMWNASTTMLLMKLMYQDEYGYYWTSTLDEGASDDYRFAFYRKILPTTGQVYRESQREDRYCSVRWVRDAK